MINKRLLAEAIFVASCGGVIAFLLSYFIFIPAYFSITHTPDSKEQVDAYYVGKTDEIVILNNDTTLWKGLQKHEECHREFYTLSDNPDHKAGYFEEIACYTYQNMYKYL